MPYNEGRCKSWSSELSKSYEQHHEMVILFFLFHFEGNSGTLLHIFLNFQINNTKFLEQKIKERIKNKKSKRKN